MTAEDVAWQDYCDRDDEARAARMEAAEPEVGCTCGATEYGAAHDFYCELAESPLDHDTIADARGTK